MISEWKSRHETFCSFIVSRPPRAAVYPQISGRREAMVRTLTIVLGATILMHPAARADDNWPQFRGPGAAGLAPPGARLPEVWSTTQNVVWKVEVPGRGLSSPIVWGDQIFLASCIREGKI